MNRTELAEPAADSGAFTYVPGSHRLTPERLAWEKRMSLAAPHSPDGETRQGSFRADPDDLTALGLPEPRLRLSELSYHELSLRPQDDHRNPVNGRERTWPNTTKNAGFY